MFLIDKELNAGVKADPFSIDGLIDWLERQPGERTYCYTKIGKCLWAQYALSLGYHASDGGEAQCKLFKAWNTAKGTNYSIFSGGLPGQNDDGSNIANTGNGDTFADALRRAKAYRARSLSLQSTRNRGDE